MNTNKLESKKSTATRCSLVAQVSNLLYRRASSLRAVRTISRAQRFGYSPDWKSAIQQVGNLRYLGCGSAAVGPFAFAFRCPAVRTFTYPVDRIFPVLQSLSHRQPVSIDIAAMT